MLVLNGRTEVTTPSEIVAEARSWINTPFHHHACKKGVGVDCVHLPFGVCRSLGIVPKGFSMPDYQMQTDGTLIKRIDQELPRVSKEEMKPGDLVVLAIDQDPQHVGIVADYRHGGLSVIHASNAPSCRPPRVIETRLMFSRGFAFVAAYRFPVWQA